jgi:hypothetical protein
MKPNWYILITRAVEEGVERGYTRAHKHVDKPDKQLLKDTIIEAVMLEICEIVNFEPDNDSN